jgi:hypothetical protein
MNSGPIQAGPRSIGSRPRRRRLSIQLEPKPLVSSMKQASACHSSHLRATTPAPCVPSMSRTLTGGKATRPWCGKITEASSPKRATSTPWMRGPGRRPPICGLSDRRPPLVQQAPLQQSSGARLGLEAEQRGARTAHRRATSPGRRPRLVSIATRCRRSTAAISWAAVRVEGRLRSAPAPYMIYVN